MKKLFLCIVLLAVLNVQGQTNKVVRGIIIDSVLVDQKLKETYAVYLPKSYDPLKLSSVVFIFDPNGFGKRAIAQFIEASEKYGHLLICSNNNKNGPYDKNFNIANRLFTKVFEQYNIDPKRIYTAGFSGGARLASTIAVLTKSIQGVIACGSGFSTHPSHTPFENTFSFASIIGDQDMNLSELINTKKFIDKIKISNELFIYEIDHRWPSQEQLLAAFDWLELEAIKKGLVKPDKLIIGQTYNKIYKEALQLEASNKLLRAHEEYMRLVDNFSPFYDVDSIKTKANHLKASKLYVKENKEVEELLEEEVRLNKLFADRFKTDLASDKIDSSWWRSEIEKLKKRKEKANSLNSIKMLNRLFNAIFVMAFETVNVVNTKSLNQKILCYDISIYIYPEYEVPYFRQIENYIKKQDEKKALNYLEKLINTGYNNTELIKNKKAFESLNNHPRFKELLNKISLR